MIYLYDGTPGSGKSYHAVIDVLRKLDRKRYNTVIANFDLDTDSSNFYRWQNSDFSVPALIDFCYDHHDPALGEAQTLVVMDEASVFFNARDWNARSHFDGSSRAEWVQFFAEHRKYRYNIILITQSDIMIDKQIRKMIETQVSHYAMNHFLCLPLKLFLCVERWYNQRKKTGQSFIRFKKRIARRYDTFAIFSGRERGFRLGREADEPVPNFAPDQSLSSLLKVEETFISEQKKSADVENSRTADLIHYFGADVDLLESGVKTP